MYIRCNFCLNLHIIHGDMEENVSGCFFSEHSVDCFVCVCLYVQYPCGQQTLATCAG